MSPVAIVGESSGSSKSHTLLMIVVRDL